MRRGDVLGLSDARPPKKPIKSAGGKRRRPKGLEPDGRRKQPQRRNLPPARVRG
jgi:hypothetical protein